MNKRGVTFIELLIYMALFAIVSLFLGRIFKSLVSNYNTGTRLVRQQTDMRDILGLMVREIRNTGLKVYLTGSGPYTKNVDDRVIVQVGTDSSSFEHGQSSSGQYGDTLKIMKIVLDKNGDLESADTISYYLEGTVLRRQFNSSDGWVKTSNSVVAENVHALQFEYGILKSDALLFRQDPIETSNWLQVAPNPQRSGTTEMILTFTTPIVGALEYSYTGFTGYPVEKHQKYRVRMDVSTAGGFPENIDYMSIIFRDQGVTEFGSERFRPYSGTVDITVPVHTTGTMFPFIGYKVNGSGIVTIKNIEVRLDEEKEYTWSSDPQTDEKKFVQAIRISVLVRTKEEAGVKADGPVTVGDVSVPRNGNYAWRLYTETVEILNNGIF